mmetsp:Transcript_61841/g.121698  ORF Transcript_61841/g.121698 Transcript_61841/m.121698 type:complete len:206 (-) Transcript_61841:2627-3244(-)
MASSYSVFILAARSSNTFLSSSGSCPQYSVSFLATMPGLPEPSSFDTASRRSETKMKYALGGRLGSLGASSPPRKRSLALACLDFCSKAFFRRKYFLPSGVFWNSLIFASYSACMVFNLSMYGFWPSAPNSSQALPPSDSFMPPFSFMKTCIGVIGGLFGMSGGSSGPFGAALAFALPLPFALALALDLAIFPREPMREAFATAR